MKSFNFNMRSLLILLFFAINSIANKGKGKPVHHHPAPTHQPNSKQPPMTPTQNQNQDTSHIGMPSNPGMVGMANPASNPANYTPATTSQEIIVRKELDPQKTARLIADLKNLMENHRILTFDLQNNVKIWYDVKNKNRNPDNKNQFDSIADKWNDQKAFRKNQTFDPTKEVFTIMGTIEPGVQPDGDTMNPYTNAPVILHDIPMLEVLRKLYIEDIYKMIYAATEAELAWWNGDQMVKANWQGAKDWAENHRRNSGYLRTHGVAHINAITMFQNFIANELANLKVDTKIKTNSNKFISKNTQPVITGRS
jgi:hypothetical protein